MADPVTVAPPIAPTPVSPWTLPVLAIIVLLIYAGVLVAVYFLQNDTLRVAIYGSVPLVVTQVINYFFGFFFLRSQYSCRNRPALVCGPPAAIYYSI